MARERIVTGDSQGEEENRFNFSLRPQRFNEYIGKKALIRKLRIGSPYGCVGIVGIVEMIGLSGAASRFATSSSCCCQPCSHFHAPARQTATIAIMKLTTCV